MAPIVHRCRLCGGERSRPRTPDDDEMEGLYAEQAAAAELTPYERAEIEADGAILIPAFRDPRDEDGALPVVCETCAAAMVARFSRPFAAAGRRTLGDTILEDFLAFCRSLSRLIDPASGGADPAEAGVGAEASPSAKSEAAGRVAPLREAIARVGHPVGLTIPMGLGIDDEDEPFLLAALTREGSYSNLTADAYTFAEMIDVESAYEYDPDGNPLD